MNFSMFIKESKKEGIEVIPLKEPGRKVVEWNVLLDGKKLGSISQQNDDDRYEYYFNVVKGIKPDIELFERAFNKLIATITKVYSK
jgi:hypothetical protein